MAEIVRIALFWIAVIAAIRLCLWFPHSLPARVLFAPQGPVRGRGEPEADYLLRCARFHGGWFAQAAALFAAGAVARAWDSTLAQSLPFVALWTAVIRGLGLAALAAAAADLVRAVAARRRTRSHIADHKHEAD